MNRDPRGNVSPQIVVGVWNELTEEVGGAGVIITPTGTFRQVLVGFGSIADKWN